MTLLDISAPIDGRLVVWPGDPPIEAYRALDIARGDPATVSRLSLGSHTGTHVDAPCHFLPDGQTLDEMPLSIFVGPARVFEIADPCAITVEELEAFDWAGVSRALFKTKNSARPWFHEPFHENFVYVSLAAADFLIARGVRLIGVDYLSVEAFDSVGAPCHKRLLGAGVALLEGLYLAQATAGDYDLTCLPLALVGADGAPARAILRPLSSMA
ncbi:MAG: cyclase family protein [Vampirovibrionales bacterium]|nr:cyclase family protein [Vampirovibrionales bacterium]